MYEKLFLIKRRNRKIKKNILLLIALMTFISVISVTANPENYKYSSTQVAAEEHNKYVHWLCMKGKGCWLLCWESGTKVCDWEEAWEGGVINGCDLQSNFEDEFNNSNSNELWDYAKDQISLNIYTGLYNSNLYISSTGVTYFRTVTWDVDTVANTEKIDIDITKSW